MPVPVEPERLGRRLAAAALRWARDWRTRAVASATVGLCFRASPMIRLSTGSSNLPHQRERSLVGAATGKPPAFFQSTGISAAGPVEGTTAQELTIRAENPRSRRPFMGRTVASATFRDHEG